MLTRFRNSWVVVRIDTGRGDALPKASLEILRTLAERCGFDTSSAVAGTTMSLPLPGPIDGYSPTLRALGRNVLGRMEKRYGRRFWLGVGGFRESEEAIGGSSAEAAQAISVARRIWRTPRAVLFLDVLPYVSLAADPAMCNRVARILAPLERYDRRKRTELQGTLDRVNDENWSAAATARAMGIHRHTVEYRLKKVEDLLALSLSDPCDRSTVEFAIIARRLLAPPR